jgi:hypothetical protein
LEQIFYASRRNKMYQDVKEVNLTKSVPKYLFTTGIFSTFPDSNDLLSK